VKYVRGTRKNYIAQRIAIGDASILFAYFDTKKDEGGHAEGSKFPI